MKPTDDGRRGLRVDQVTAGFVREVTGRDIRFPVVSFAGTATGGGYPDTLVAVGGLAWYLREPEAERARCDIWLDVLAPEEVPPVALVRWARRMLRMAAQFGEPAVYCLRDADEPTSAKLLALVGMSLDERVIVEEADGSTRLGECWKWRASPLSQPSLPSDRPSSAPAPQSMAPTTPTSRA